MNKSQLLNERFNFWKERVKTLPLHSEFSYDSGVLIKIYQEKDFLVLVHFSRHNKQSQVIHDIRLGYVKNSTYDQSVKNLKIYMQLSDKNAFVCHSDSEAGIYISGQSFLYSQNGISITEDEFKIIQQKFQNKKDLIKKVSDIN